MKRVYLSGAQKDVYFDDFCRLARYDPQLRRYRISVAGRNLSSAETDELFDMYLAEVRKLKQETCDV
jgi:hypothetical protein